MVNTTQALGSVSPGGLRRLDSGGSNGVPERHLQMTPLPRGLTGAEPESEDSRTRWGNSGKTSVSSQSCDLPGTLGTMRL